MQKPELEALNGQLVFDDPLSSTPSNLENAEFEWDNVTETAFTPAPSKEEPSGIFQLSEELSNIKLELEQCRQKLRTYEEVLTLKDQQLFELRDKISSQEFDDIHSDAYKNLEVQAQSYREQNSLLNEEVLKLQQMYNKTISDSKNQTKRADELAIEVRKFQRDYLAALGSCVYRPLVDPDDGALLEIPNREHHLLTLKSLARTMKSKNDRILGCPIPSLGKSEHIDAFSFVHSLPNEPLQVQYLCQHLHEAYRILMETDEENQKNLKKWKSCIMDSSEQFELTAQLRKLVLRGVPSQYRAYLWQKLIYYYVSDLRKNCQENYFEIVLGRQELMADNKAFKKYLKQITMDVPRTMPMNKDYAMPDSIHRERLQKVLIAFCVHSPTLGYCQGYNFLAGGCLLFLEEEDAFWFLVAVTEKIFPPNYYKNGLAGLLADQYVLQDIIFHYLPKLHEHLIKFPEIDLAAVTTGWFLGLFFDCLPFQTLIRVWDCFLAYGHEAVFRVSFAMFKLFQTRLIDLNELSQLLHGAKNIPKLCTDPSELIKEAFNSSFPSWEDIEEMRSQKEEQLIAMHEKKMQQRRFYDQRLMLLDENYGPSQSFPDDKWIYNCGAASDRFFILGACCGVAQNSQIFELEASFIKALRLPITDRVMCLHVITDDVVLLGLFSGQLQAYSLSESTLLWSMSLSDVVLNILLYDDVMLCVGSADGKIHILHLDESDLDRGCRRKPNLIDSIELSKRPATCACHIVDHRCLWIASGPAIYVISVETTETDGFFLISSTIEQVSSMIHWSNKVLIAICGSSVVQLHGTELFNNPPLLVFDIARQCVLPLLYPMIPNDGDVKSPTASRVTCMTEISDDIFWIATAGGDILMYKLERKDDTEITNSLDSEQSGDLCDTGLYSLRLQRTEHASERPIRCLVKSYLSVVSCSGFYGEENSLKIWNFDGDFAIPETSISRSSSSDVDDSKSHASSSRSLDLDARASKSDGTSESLKTAVKSAAAAAVKSKPLRKLMNMFAGDSNQ